MNKHKKAQNIIEIMLAIAIVVITASGLSIALTNETLMSHKLIDEAQALNFAQEGVEATRSIWNRNPLLVTEGTWGLSIENDGWELSGTSDTPAPGVTRTVTIFPVYRDNNRNIVENPEEGTLDRNTVIIECNVTWEDGLFGAQTKTLKGYLGNWQGKDWITTTLPELQTGTFTDTKAKLTLQEPPDQNAHIELAMTIRDSGFFSDVEIGHHAKDVVVRDGYAYVATLTSSAGLVVVDVRDVENPRVVTSLNIGGKTNGIALHENYAYLALAKDDEQLAIVDISNPESPVLIRKQGWAMRYARNIDIHYPYVYLATDDEDFALMAINVSDPQNPVLEKKLTLHDADDGATGIAYYEGHIYVGTDEKDEQGNLKFYILDATSLGVIRTMSLKQTVNDIVFDPATNDAFLAINHYKPAFAIVNMTDPNNPIIRSELRLNVKATNVTFDPPNIVYVTTHDTNDTLNVIDVTDRERPIVSSIIDVEERGRGLTVVPPYVYIAIDTSNEGLVIIGASEHGFAPIGTYTSSVFDTTSANTIIKRIEINGVVPEGTNLKIQMRTSQSAAQIQNATFVGPDGTASTFYSIGTAIPKIAPDATGTQYIQWQATLESSATQTPRIHDVHITYFP